MAVPTTYKFHNGNGNNGVDDRTFSYGDIDNAASLVAADLLIKVQESGVWVTKTGNATDYTVDKPEKNIVFESGKNPANGTKNIRIERYTDVNAAEAVFAPGSSIKSLDLNKNQDQFRHSAAELTNTKVDTITPTIQGPIKYEDGNGKTTTLTFNGGLDFSDNATVDVPNADGTIIVNTMAHNKLLVGTTQTDSHGNQIMRKSTIAGDVTLSHDNSSNVASITIGEIDHDLTIDNKELVFKDGTGKTLKLNAHGKGNLTKNQTIVLPDADGTVIVNTMGANKLLVGSTATDGDGNQIMKKADVGGDVTLSHDLNSNKANITIGDIDHDLTIDNKELIFKDGTGKTLKLSAHNKANLTSNRDIDLPDADGTVVVNLMNANKLLVGSTDTNSHGDQIMKKADVGGDVTLAHDSNTNTANFTIGQGKIDSGNLDPALLVTNSEHGSHTANDTSLYTTQASDARFYRKGSADDIESSGVPWSGNDTTVATTAAIDKRIVDIVDDVGGFVALTNEASIPQYHPEKENTDTADRVGTIISIGVIAKSGGYTPSGGTVTIPASELTNHSVNATITDCGSTVLAEGFGVLVETTAQTDAQYAAGPAFKFHRLTPKATEVTTVAGKATEITTVASNDSNITAVAGNATNINTVASNATNINSVASNATNVNTVATNITDVSNFADLYQIATSAPDKDGGNNDLAAGDLWFDSSSNKTLKVHNGTTFQSVSPTQSVLDDISIVSGSLTRKEDLGSIADDIAEDSSTGALDTCATNITNINTFANVYRIASSAPSSSLDEGDLWYDSTGNVLKYYNGTAWVVTAAAGLSEVSEDTTPKLGGHLDCDDKNLTKVGTVSGDNLQIDFGVIA